MKPKRKLVKNNEELIEKYHYNILGIVSNLRIKLLQEQLKNMALNTNVRIVLLEVNKRLFSKSIFFKVKGNSTAMDNFKYKFINHF